MVVGEPGKSRPTLQTVATATKEYQMNATLKAIRTFEALGMNDDAISAALDAMGSMGPTLQPSTPSPYTPPKAKKTYETVALPFDLSAIKSWYESFAKDWKAMGDALSSNGIDLSTFALTTGLRTGECVKGKEQAWNTLAAFVSAPKAKDPIIKANGANAPKKAKKVNLVKAQA